MKTRLYNPDRAAADQNRLIPKNARILVIILFSVFFSGCAGYGEGDTRLSAIPVRDSEEGLPDTRTAPLPGWMQVPMTDCRSGEEVSLKSFISGEKPLIIHTFTIWCPACTYQLQETKKIRSESAGPFEVLAIDIDAREGCDDIAGHITKNSLTDGYYVVAPQGVLQGMVATFGYDILLSMPRTVVICNNTAIILKPGAYPAPVLQRKLEEVC